MWLLREIERVTFQIIDALLPHSPEAVIARSLSEETLARLLHPVTYKKEPWITALLPYYNPRVRALIWAIKFRSEQGPLPALGTVAGREIASMLEKKAARDGWRNVLFTPIPSSPDRMRSRGYNQSERIALAVLPHLGDMIEYSPDILSRKNRESQVRLSPERRHRNVEGAFFTLRPEKVRGRYIVLIDDVVETGATLTDARRALLASGAAGVLAVVMAH